MECGVVMVMVSPCLRDDDLVIEPAAESRVMRQFRRGARAKQTKSFRLDKNDRLPLSTMLSFRLQSFARHQARRYLSYRAFPQYSVFGEDCMLAIKIMMPQFRLIRGDTLVVLDGSKRGRILIEWTPREKATGGMAGRDSQVRFGLSPEEVGLLLDQLPEHEVEFVRKVPDSADKIMIAKPADGGAVAFQVEHEQKTLQVNVQRGEFVVISEIMRSSLPTLVGWSTMMEVAMQKSLDDLPSYTPF